MNYKSAKMILKLGGALFGLGLGRQLIPPKHLTFTNDDAAEFLDVEAKNYGLFTQVSYWHDLHRSVIPMRQTKEYFLQPVQVSHKMCQTKEYFLQPVQVSHKMRDGTTVTVKEQFF